MSGDKKDSFDFDPWDGTPGAAWEKFEARLWDGTTKTDNRGWSLADHLKGQDEGQPPPIGTGVAFPANPAENRKAQNAFRKRQKESYGNLGRVVGAPYYVTRSIERITAHSDSRETGVLYLPVSSHRARCGKHTRLSRKAKGAAPEPYSCTIHSRY